MREIRIYQPGNYRVGDNIDLNNSATQHVAVVLRMQVGQPLTLFNGNNDEFIATIVTLNKKRVTVLVLTKHHVDRESPCQLHLVQAVSKSFRMELVIQKAVELGVASITPLITDYCAVKLDLARQEKKQAQWQAIAISACEQSGRNSVPPIYPIQSLSDYLQQKNTNLKLVLSPLTAKKWRDYPISHHDTSLLIGPEGGLSNTELQSIMDAGFAPLSLGPRILRTETAAITALSVLQATRGDL